MTVNFPSESVLAWAALFAVTSVTSTVTAATVPPAESVTTPATYMGGGYRAHPTRFERGWSTALIDAVAARVLEQISATTAG